MRGDGGQEIIFAGREHGEVGGGAWCDHADDIAADEFLARAGLLHLFADGHLETCANEAGDISIGGVVGDAAHGNGLPALAGT